MSDNVVSLAKYKRQRRAEGKRAVRALVRRRLAEHREALAEIVAKARHCREQIASLAEEMAELPDRNLHVQAADAYQQWTRVIERLEAECFADRISAWRAL